MWVNAICPSLDWSDVNMSNLSCIGRVTCECCEIGVCLPLQVAVCTCSVLCAEQSGAGCAESAGTMSVWETTGLDNTKHTHTVSQGRAG